MGPLLLVDMQFSARYSVFYNRNATVEPDMQLLVVVLSLTWKLSTMWPDGNGFIFKQSEKLLIHYLKLHISQNWISADSTIATTKTLRKAKDTLLEYPPEDETVLRN